MCKACEAESVCNDFLSQIADRITPIIDSRIDSEIAEYRSENERDKAMIRKKVNEVKQKADSAEQAEASHTGESALSDDSMTPMERLIAIGEDSFVENVTASVRRAKAIAEYFGQWAKRTPNGLVIKEGLKNLVETATGENLFWKQIERAGHALEKFTKGAIQFKKTRRHGWTLVAEPAFVKQLQRASSAPGG